ncbi:hypothetical protein QNH36_19205 [Mesobacillus sp. AQ2]|uniref:hypothetical protein n=1 Tax=Bacillaceae TaxID=186817 RepID=UPI001642872E|nr:MULTISPECIES: hypothetical protein [Bacillaceae]WHX39756.1 hypothetical protein QNH36_19205 [Mesobacillus sp. AQ2]
MNIRDRIEKLRQLEEFKPPSKSIYMDVINQPVQQGAGGLFWAVLKSLCYKSG